MRTGVAKLVAIGVAVLLIGLVAKFPARVALQLAPDAVRISGISGTIWQGRAGGLLVSGVYLRNVEWRSSPLSLLTGRLKFAVKASPANGFIESDVAVGFTGVVRLENLSAALPLSILADAINVPGLAGNSSLQFAELAFADGAPTSADGALDIANMLVPALSTDSLGGYRLEFSNFEDGIIGSVEDTDGVIDIAGTVNLGAGGAYSLLAQLSAKQQAPASLKRQIEFLPDGTAPGQHELRLEGSL